MLNYIVFVIKKSITPTDSTRCISANVVKVDYSSSSDALRKQDYIHFIRNAMTLSVDASHAS